MAEKVLASFAYQLFPKDGKESDNGFYICQYKCIDGSLGRSRFICKGNIMPRGKANDYILTLERKKDSYGEYFGIVSYQDHISEDKDGILRYLQSGLIKGIGQKTAEKIYEMFGERSLDILANDIDSLLKVKGITAKKLEKIKESYEENCSNNELNNTLLGFGLSASQIKSVFAVFKEDTADVVKNHPYRLIKVHGLDFEKVDAIGKEMGVAEDDYDRILAAAIWALKSAYRRGDTCMEVSAFVQSLLSILRTNRLNEADAYGYLRSMIIAKRLFYRTDDDKKQYVFLPEAIKAEYDIAKEILRLSERKKEQYSDLAIKAIKASGGLSLDSEQIRAITGSMEEPFSAIIGGPGTGKTTIINTICNLFETVHHGSKKILLLSPTGRAARQMAKKSGRKASTIHHKLKLKTKEESGTYADDIEDIDADLVIIDEFSMVDTFLAQKLFSAIRHAKVIIVGDSEQLKSVGPGDVLGQIVASNVVPVFTLEYLHRQENDSEIVKCAEALREGKVELVEKGDLHVVELDDLKEVEEEMSKCYMEEAAKRGIENVICLCPFRKGDAGVDRMNAILQDRLNGLGIRWDKTTRDFRIGDPVMHLANTDTLSNGDVGMITSFAVKGGDDVMEVTYFETQKEYYKVEDLQDLTLAYATTYHKSQGSEYEAVIMNLSNYHSYALGKNLIKNLPYTGITRAKKEVFFFGNVSAVVKAAGNTLARKTLLARELKKQYEKLHPVIEEKEEYTQLKLAL